MSVLIEAITVVVRVDAIAMRVAGERLRAALAAAETRAVGEGKETKKFHSAWWRNKQ